MRKRISASDILLLAFIFAAIYGMGAFIFWMQSEVQAEKIWEDFDSPVAAKGVPTGKLPDISQLVGKLELSTSPEMLILCVPPGSKSKSAKYFPMLRPTDKSLMLVWKIEEPIKIRLVNRFYKTFRPDKVTLYTDFSRQENRRFLAPAISAREIPLKSTQKWVDLKIQFDHGCNPIILRPVEKLPKKLTQSPGEIPGLFCAKIVEIR